MASTSSGGTSKMSSSCTWSSIRLRSLRSAMAAWMRIMASLIRSAAEPWSGEFCALRSP